MCVPGGSWWALWSAWEWEVLLLGCSHAPSSAVSRQTCFSSGSGVQAALKMQGKKKKKAALPSSWTVTAQIVQQFLACDVRNTHCFFGKWDAFEYTTQETGWHILCQSSERYNSLLSHSATSVGSYPSWTPGSVNKQQSLCSPPHPDYCCGFVSKGENPLCDLMDTSAAAWPFASWDYQT